MSTTETMVAPQGEPPLGNEQVKPHGDDNETENLSSPPIPTPAATEETENLCNDRESLEKSNEVGEQTKPDVEPNDEAPKMVWPSKANLFCRVNGRSHATLVDFGYQHCQQCGEDLSPPTNMEAESASSNSDSSSTTTTEEESDRDEEDVQDIAYAVEYRDIGDYLIGSEPWDGAFDISSVNQPKISALEIVTVLSTSIPADSNRRQYESDGLMHGGLLNKPNLTVKVASTRLTIHSAPLLQLLRKYVRYYPSSNLDAAALQIEEPFPLIAHHYDELESHRSTYGTKQVSEGASSQGKDKEAASSQNEDEETVSSHKQDEEAAEVTHLGLLLDYFRKTILGDIEEERARYSQEICTFRMLWLLYKPGNTVYLESNGHLSAFVVQSVKTDPTILSTVAPKRPKPYEVKVWNLNFDGKCVGRNGRSITIAPFEGERKITSLRLIPCEFLDREDGGKTRDALEENGKKWYELLPGGQVHYSGPLLDEHKRQLDGRVYVDHASFYTYESTEDPELDEVRDYEVEQELESRYPWSYRRNRDADQLAKCQCEDCRGLRPHPPPGFPWVFYDILDPIVDKDLTLPGAREGERHRYLLCGRLLHGFDLKSRTWVKLDVAYCKPPRVNLKAIDMLVMPSERKDMIKALIQKFTSNGSGKPRHQTWRADYIENKGDGRIFLLHGSPGVGKTYTAECIAEYTERPLLSLTCGDIGTDEVKMERQLSKWFQLAEKWGAVMLIDEADVYLERRQVTDLKRNSLVSVFLRCIEYYRGILFLTTNRVGHFDDAFISRIHVIIRYDNLTPESRKKIWRQFFDKLDDDREDFKTTKRAKDYVLGDGEGINKMEWNGREIRNAFQTAVALAEYRFLQSQESSKQGQPTLDQKDFEQVCDMMQQFKSYLTNIHNLDEDSRAFNAGSRAHGYT